MWAACLGSLIRFWSGLHAGQRLYDSDLGYCLKIRPALVRDSGFAENRNEISRFTHIRLDSLREGAGGGGRNSDSWWGDGHNTGYICNGYYYCNLSRGYRVCSCCSHGLEGSASWEWYHMHYSCSVKLRLLDRHTWSWLNGLSGCFCCGGDLTVCKRDVFIPILVRIIATDLKLINSIRW